MMEIQEISFRRVNRKILGTGFGIFSLYKYPAKFIPQVPAFVLENYAKRGMRVFDPFAGCGTVGYVARVYGFDYELWDLNPLLGYLHGVCEVGLMSLFLIEEIKACSLEFLPSWRNLSYWYPEEFLGILSRVWGFYHYLADECTKNFLLIPFLRLTKYFSYADEKVHKLYKSRYAKKKVEGLLKQDYWKLFYYLLEKEFRRLNQKVAEYQSLKLQRVNYVVKAGVDVLEGELEGMVNILITSPPYLQAQEYIRSTKLELFWLGFDEDYIRRVSGKEIPYREVPRIEVFSDTYYVYKDMIEEEHLLRLYENYFHAILFIFERLGERVSDYMFIFVGPAKVRGFEVPIHWIIVEHLDGKGGWEVERIYEDRIVSRVMYFLSRNPATGVENSRIDREYLIVLRRRGS